MKNNPVLPQLISLLNDGNFHDGSTLGKALNITRSAVWKNIKKLQKYGIAIQSCKGKGYQLTQSFTLLVAEKIKEKLQDKNIAIVVMESMTSTNDYFKSAKFTSKAAALHPIVCLSEQQTQGRGRLARSWHSPFGQNIYLSCLYHFQKDVSELAGLSLVIALTIIKTIKRYGLDQSLYVKWPNDIVWMAGEIKQKISGCLIEIRAETHSLSQAIIGIGLNVNMQTANHISQDWTSMQKLLGYTLDRNDVAASLLKQLFTDLAQFNAHGFAHFIPEWVATDYLTHKTICLHNMNQTISGKVMGVNQQGHLLLQLPDGRIENFSSGDTTLS